MASITGLSPDRPQVDIMEACQIICISKQRLERLGGYQRELKREWSGVFFEFSEAKAQKQILAIIFDCPGVEL
jgi:hypothetical protein